MIRRINDSRGMEVFLLCFDRGRRRLKRICIFV
jgi:hypothetical protein